MNRSSGWGSVRQAALTMALLCGLGAALTTAEAQVPPVGAPGIEAPAVEPDGAVDVTAVEPETPSPWSLGLVTATIAVAIGGMSSVLGIWVHRNEDRPLSNAIAMTSLVIAASTVGIVQSYLDAQSGIAHAEELRRMLDMVDEIALESGDPALAEIVKAEGGASYSPFGGR